MADKRKSSFPVQLPRSLFSSSWLKKVFWMKQEKDQRLVNINYSDIIMSAMASQITSPTIAYSIIYSCAGQRKHQSSASLAFVREFHRWPVDSPLKGPVTRKMFITRNSEVIMFSPCVFVCVCLCLSRCLSGRFKYEGLVPHKQYFAGTSLGMSSCASYVSLIHDVIDDVTR